MAAYAEMAGASGEFMGPWWTWAALVAVGAFCLWAAFAEYRAWRQSR